jgi:flagellar hook-associated protein 3 FlgL
MIRITANTLANRLTTDLTRLGSTQSRLTQQMASGKRLIDASDDVPAAGRVMGYESEKRSLQQYERNAQRGSTDIAVGTTALMSIHDLASKAFNLAPAASASGDPAQHAALATQIDGLLEQAVSLANIQVNGNYLFGAQETGTAPFSVTRNVAGQITAVTYNGTAGAAPQIAVSEGAQIATTTSGTQNQQLEDYLNHLAQVRDAVAVDNKPLINSLQNSIGDDEDHIVNMQSILASSQYRLEVTRTQNTTRYNQLSDLSSNETDVNMAETIVKYQSSDRSYQAALQAGAKMMKQSLLDYI